MPKKKVKRETKVKTGKKKEKKKRKKKNGMMLLIYCVISDPRWSIDEFEWKEQKRKKKKRYSEKRKRNITEKEHALKKIARKWR